MEFSLTDRIRASNFLSCNVSQNHGRFSPWKFLPCNLIFLQYSVCQYSLLELVLSWTFKKPGIFPLENLSPTKKYLAIFCLEFTPRNFIPWNLLVTQISLHCLYDFAQKLSIYLSFYNSLDLGENIMKK